MIRIREKNVPAILAVSLLGSLPAPANAFIFLKGSYEKGERPVNAAPAWPGRVVRFYVNTNISYFGGSATTTVTAAEFLQATTEAVNAWAAACRADLRVEITGTTGDSYNANDGVNVIQWDNRTAGEGNFYNPNSASTLAAANTVISGDQILDCDIVVNGATTTKLAYSPSAIQADLRSVLTHEIGHCLGLDHPIEPGSYNSSNPYLQESTLVQTTALASPDDTTRRDIAQDDRDGIECIYERGRPIRTGKRCTSYHGTNGNGTIVGQNSITTGPSDTDTVCGTDAQGRNARPSEENGDGCVPSAIGSTGGKSNPPTRFLGTSWSFIGFFCLAYAIRRRFRRSLLAGALVVAASSTTDARAWDLELSAAGKKSNPTDWKTFSAMDPTVTNWDRAPSEVAFPGQSELSATLFYPTENWGQWGWFGTFTVPKSVSTNAKAQGAAEQSKETSIWGFRIGPSVRWYPLETMSSLQWYVGGKFGLGFLSGSQSFASSTSGSFSYRAYSTEFALSTGVEVPIFSSARFVIEGGYSRLHSSYFTSTGNTGTLYSDFPSGTRLAVANGNGSADLKFKSDGLYAAVGVKIPLGAESENASERKPEPKYDDYEGSPTPKETEKPVLAPEAQTQIEPPVAKPIEVPALAPMIPAPAPIPSPVPTPRSAPEPLSTRKSWEIDVPPAPDSTTPAIPKATPRPNEPDPIPL